MGAGIAQGKPADRCGLLVSAHEALGGVCGESVWAGVLGVGINAKSLGEEEDRE